MGICEPEVAVVEICNGNVPSEVVVTYELVVDTSWEGVVGEMSNGRFQWLLKARG